MIPQELQQIASYLSAENITLPVIGTDTRADSAEAEKYIVAALQNSSEFSNIFSPNIGQKTNRAWYDIGEG